LEACRQPLLCNRPSENWKAEQVARQDVHRTANGQTYIDLGVCQVEGDFASRIAEANHKHAFADKPRAIAIFAAVEEYPSEIIVARPIGAIRKIGPSRCYHDHGGRHAVLIRIDAPLRAIASDLAYCGVEDWLDAEMCCVALQVLNDLRSGRIFGVALRHRHPGQTGMAAIGMQVKAVVVPSPDRADGIFLLDDHMTNTSSAHAGGAGKACQPSPNNDCMTRHRLQ
jgi:hypothetical protein